MEQTTIAAARRWAAPHRLNSTLPRSSSGSASGPGRSYSRAYAGSRGAAAAAAMAPRGRLRGRGLRGWLARAHRSCVVGTNTCAPGLRQRVGQELWCGRARPRVSLCTRPQGLKGTRVPPHLHLLFTTHTTALADRSTARKRPGRQRRRRQGAWHPLLRPRRARTQPSTTETCSSKSSTH
jgi:hypothetical protein